MHFHKNGTHTVCLSSRGQRRCPSPKKAATNEGKEKNESNSTALQVSSYVTGEPGPTSSAAIHSPIADIKRCEYREKHRSHAVMHNGRRHERNPDASKLERVASSPKLRIWEECARQKTWTPHKVLYSSKKKERTESRVTPTSSDHERIFTKEEMHTHLNHVQLRERIVVGSGASLHMMGSTLCYSSRKENLHPQAKFDTIQTANGVVEVTREAEVYIDELDT